MAHKILNLKIKDFIFKVTEEDTQFAEVFIAGGYASVCYIQEINILPKTHSTKSIIKGLNCEKFADYVQCTTTGSDRKLQARLTARNDSTASEPDAFNLLNS